MESALFLCVLACNYRKEENGTNLIRDPILSSHALHYHMQLKEISVLFYKSINSSLTFRMIQLFRSNQYPKWGTDLEKILP